MFICVEITLAAAKQFQSHTPSRTDTSLFEDLNPAQGNLSLDHLFQTDSYSMSESFLDIHLGDYYPLWPCGFPDISSAFGCKPWVTIGVIACSHIFADDKIGGFARTFPTFAYHAMGLWWTTLETRVPQLHSGSFLQFFSFFLCILVLQQRLLIFFMLKTHVLVGRCGEVYLGRFRKWLVWVGLSCALRWLPISFLCHLPGWIFLWCAVLLGHWPPDLSPRPFPILDFDSHTSLFPTL